jgi:hypothetical protein
MQQTTAMLLHWQSRTGRHCTCHASQSMSPVIEVKLQGPGIEMMAETKNVVILMPPKLS